MINPYQVLGVSESASQDEIKKAYKKLAGKYHPDRNPNDKESEQKFKDVNEAYQLIGDPEARKKYDSGGIDEQAFEENFNQGFRAGEFNFSFDDLENDFFDQIFGFSSGRGRRGGGFGFGFGGGQAGPGGGAFQGGARQRKGQDSLYRMEVGFHDAILGGKRIMTKPDGKQLEINIPAGVKDGQKLRFKGQGEPSPMGGPRGDLLVELQVSNTTNFTRKGNNIETEVHVPLETAILGGTIKVPGLKGQYELNIPAYTSSGKKMRLKGKGVPEKGDLIVRLLVDVPSQPDEKLTEAIKQWQGHTATSGAETE